MVREDGRSSASVWYRLIISVWRSMSLIWLQTFWSSIGTMIFEITALCDLVNLIKTLWCSKLIRYQSLAHTLHLPSPCFYLAITCKEERMLSNCVYLMWEEDFLYASNWPDNVLLIQVHCKIEVGKQKRCQVYM